MSNALSAGGLAITEWGADGAPPLVFLHGLGPSGPGVADQAAPIWAERYGFRVLVPALPGFAGSPAVDDARCTPTELARIVEAALDELGVDRFALVGFSWGGSIGCRIDPKRLVALVLLDVGYQSYPGEPPTLEERRAEFADADVAPPALVAAAFHGVDVEPPSGAFPALATAGVPILLLAATEPPVERRTQDLEQFRIALPSAEVRQVQGAEHNVLETAPDEAIPAVGEWLGSKLR